MNTLKKFLILSLIFLSASSLLIGEIYTVSDNSFSVHYNIEVPNQFKKDLDTEGSKGCYFFDEESRAQVSSFYEKLSSETTLDEYVHLTLGGLSEVVQLKNITIKKVIINERVWKKINLIGIPIVEANEWQVEQELYITTHQNVAYTIHGISFKTDPKILKNIVKSFTIVENE